MQYLKHKIAREIGADSVLEYTLANMLPLRGISGMKQGMSKNNQITKSQCQGGIIHE